MTFVKCRGKYQSSDHIIPVSLPPKSLVILLQFVRVIRCPGPTDIHSETLLVIVNEFLTLSKLEDSQISLRFGTLAESAGYTA
jgi:hypothetical protein